MREALEQQRAGVAPAVLPHRPDARRHGVLLPGRAGAFGVEGLGRREQLLGRRSGGLGRLGPGLFGLGELRLRVGQVGGGDVEPGLDLVQLAGRRGDRGIQRPDVAVRARQLVAQPLQLLDARGTADHRGRGGSHGGNDRCQAGDNGKDHDMTAHWVP